MKRLVYLLLISLLVYGCASQKDQQAKLDRDAVLFSVDDQPITTGEFMYSYTKNNPSYDTISPEEDIRNYLDLFQNFKLKVIKAKDLGYDTIDAYISEFEGYKQQLAQPYLTETKIKEQAMRAAYERMKHMVSASHILLMVDENAAPQDTLDAYNKLVDIRQQILNDQLTFSEAAAKYSEDPSAKQNQGDLGYFSAFRMVPEFEKAAFSTAEDSITEPVRTSYGYHIIKVEDKVSIPEKVDVAHIYTNRNTSSDSMARAKIKKAYAALQNGEEWDKVVAEYSEDPQSKDKGGMLNEVPYNRIDGTFYINAVKTDTGSYSEPFQTRFGWHIVKVYDKKEFDSYQEISSKPGSILNRAVTGTKEEAIETIKRRNDFMEFEENLQTVKALADQSILQNEWRFSPGPELGDKPLFKINDISYTVGDFINYVEKNQQSIKAKTTDDKISQLYEKWLENKLYDYEIYDISREKPQFRYLLQEYREGILLFEIMEDSVWNKAIADTTGLKDYFARNRSEYQWNQHVEGAVYEFSDSTLARKAYQNLKNDSIPDRGKLRREDRKFVYLSGPFEKEDNQWVDRTNWEPGTYYFTGPEKVFIVEVKSIGDPRPKDLDETRGQVISDYQSHLEEKWIRDLREEYEINLNEEVLQAIINYVNS